MRAIIITGIAFITIHLSNLVEETLVQRIEETFKIVLKFFYLSVFYNKTQRAYRLIHLFYNK